MQSFFANDNSFTSASHFINLDIRKSCSSVKPRTKLKKTVTILIVWAKIVLNKVCLKYPKLRSI